MGQCSQASACQALGLQEKPLSDLLCVQGQVLFGVLTRHPLWLLPSGLVCFALVLVGIHGSSDEAPKLRNAQLCREMVQWRRQMAGGGFYSCELSIKAGLCTMHYGNAAENHLGTLDREQSTQKCPGRLPGRKMMSEKS